MANKDQSRIRDFLRQQKLAVIATVRTGQMTPESALIAYAEDDALRLYFQTARHTRKATNLSYNPHVSLVIGLDLGSLKTLQYEGIAEQLTDNNDLEICKQRFIDKDSPTTAEYFNNPAAIFFRVRPTWISYSDYSGPCPEVIELREVL